MPTQTGNDGTILSLAQAKSDLEISNTRHDDFIGDLIQQAESRLEEFTGNPINGTTFTEKHDGGKFILFLEHNPIDETSVTITDTQGTEDTADDETVKSKYYRIRAEEGEIVRTSSLGRKKEWAKGINRFEVEYDAGLDLHPRWSQTVEHTLRRSLAQLVVVWYENRDPDRSSEQLGAGFGNRYKLEDVPERILGTWVQYSNSLW